MTSEIKWAPSTITFFLRRRVSRGFWRQDPIPSCKKLITWPSPIRKLIWIKLGRSQFIAFQFNFNSIPVQLYSFSKSFQLGLTLDFASQTQLYRYLRNGLTNFDEIKTIFHLRKFPITYTMKWLLTRGRSMVVHFLELCTSATCEDK
jgi:hypothetical protein